MPLRAELMLAVTPVACALIAATISPSVSRRRQIDVGRDVVAIRDADMAQRSEARSAL